jgi:hypothetical protein
MMKRVLGAMLTVGVVLSSVSVFASGGDSNKTNVSIVDPKPRPIVCPKECYKKPPKDYYWIMRNCPPQCYRPIVK